MQRSAMSIPRYLLLHRAQTQLAERKVKPCDVFINHRGIDTKQTIATLLYDNLSRLNFKPFLDNRSMKPGDKLFDKIDSAIRGCKVGVAVFSPRYCDSYFCLHEVALMMELKKKVIPIFCDIKPSELRVKNAGMSDPEELKRFDWALEEAKYTVGLTYNSSRGNLAQVITQASSIVIESLMEMEGKEKMKHQKASLIPDKSSQLAYDQY